MPLVICYSCSPVLPGFTGLRQADQQLHKPKTGGGQRGIAAAAAHRDEEVLRPRRTGHTAQHRNKEHKTAADLFKGGRDTDQAAERARQHQEAGLSPLTVVLFSAALPLLRPIQGRRIRLLPSVIALADLLPIQDLRTQGALPILQAFSILCRALHIFQLHAAFAQRFLLPAQLFFLFPLLEMPVQPRDIAVIGVPVGFVNVVEAKERLWLSGIPCIAAMGRRGGSNVAAAIVNALLYGIPGVRS